ncbi:MAG TPA: AcvB/VirJ family lysyl-phosphatidylglycerol hydrolase [Steroidobacteraceae bacterium]|nr:AcvB/VirJ family lysyl-phosphatidylglycerol hydrolase [Steroidobacteraceae bacterium]
MGHRSRIAVTLAFLAIGCLPAPAAPAARTAPVVPEHLNHGRFHDIAVYAPSGTPTSLVLLLSDEGGWDRAADTLALELVKHGAMVAGIDLPQLRANLEADRADCVFPDGDLENLSHFLQAYYHWPTYLTPFLVGVGAGASLAYASLAQAPGNTFAGALTLGFCPISTLRKPLCKGSGVEWTPGPKAGQIRYLPVKKLDNPWVALQAERGAACNPDAVREFVEGVTGAALVPLPQVASDYAASGHWLPQFLAAYDTLVSRSSKRLAPAPPAALGDLPVVEIAAQSGAAPTDSFAIILSGDGGWAGLDKEVAAALSARGVPVVGLDSLRYFWHPRTPDGLAADTDRLIRYYLAHLGKQRVLLIGYSQGADVLPFALNRLPQATRARVALAVLIAMSEHALFEFHLTSWISSDNSGLATMPEVERMSGTPVVCIYGEGDADSLCPELDATKVRIVKLKGGHHFNGDYAGLAREILAAENR